MEKINDILLFDVVEYGFLSDKIKWQIQEKIRQIVKKFKFGNVTPVYQLTGDGYYIGIETSEESHIYLLNLIATLIKNLEEIEIRFVLHTGNVKILKDINNGITFTGRPLEEANRIIDSLKVGNMILASKSFYNQHIGGVLVPIFDLPEKNKIITHKAIEVIDKHKDKHIAYSITYTRSGIEYGFEFSNYMVKSGEFREDLIDHISFQRILEFAFRNCKIETLGKYDIKKPLIGYSYYRVKISDFSTEHFLFMKNSSNKIQLIEHFFSNNKHHKNLTICVNKKGKDKKIIEFWKSDFISKFVEAKKIKENDFNFYYLDDFIWDKCIPSNLKTRQVFSKEKDFISPAYTFSITENENRDRILDAEIYLLNWINRSFGPIAVTYGNGGIGKTTLLKNVADKLQNDEQSKKFVFFIEGDSLAKGINQVVDKSQIKVDSLKSLIRYSLLSLTNSQVLNFFNDEELLELLVSSGTVVVIIDGLDEISAALKQDFDLNAFLTDILSIDQILNNLKIVISTRKTFWLNELSKVNDEVCNYFHLIQINGFTKIMLNEYFLKKFNDDEEDVKNAIALLNQFTKSKTIFYIPFVALVVSELIKKNSKNIKLSKAKSDYLDTNNEFDVIVINVLEREEIRQMLNMSIDDFLDLFKEIVIDYNNKMPFTFFEYYISHALPAASTSTESACRSLLDNVFIRRDGDFITISYDFIYSHIKAAFVVYFIKKKLITEHFFKSLADDCFPRDDFIAEISDRIKNLDNHREIFKEFFQAIIKGKRKFQTDHVLLVSIEKTISFLLYLSSKIFTEKFVLGKEERIDVVKELYNNNISEMHIYGNYYTLDFSSITVRNSTFVGFNNIIKSKFDKNTRFIDCRLNNILLENGVIQNTSLCPENFDITCKIDENIREFINSSKNTIDNAQEAIKKDLINLLRSFFDGGRVLGKKLRHLSFQTNCNIDSKKLIKELKNKGLITDKYMNPPYNWGIEKGYIESAQQLVFNNFADNMIEEFINYLFNKYYVK